MLRAGAKVLAEEGAGALTTRRIANEVGTSTTAVYTYFGSLERFVQELIHVAFDHLSSRLAAVTPTADPFHDLVRFNLAYRDAALDSPHFYHAMFSASPIRLSRRAPEDIRHARATFDSLVRAVERCCAAGLMPYADTPESAAEKLWAAAHGVVMLELAGFFDDRGAAAHTSTLFSLYHGLGVSIDVLESTFAALGIARAGV